MKEQPRGVKCLNCKWRGRRVPRYDCDCFSCEYGVTPRHSIGACPKCNETLALTPGVCAAVHPSVTETNPQHIHEADICSRRFGHALRGSRGGHDAPGHVARWS